MGRMKMKAGGRKKANVFRILALRNDTYFIAVSKSEKGERWRKFYATMIFSESLT